MGFNVRAKCGYACAAIVVYLLLSAAPCRAAKFRLVVPQPAAPMGQESEAFVVLVPENGEKVMGAWLTLTVNKDYLLLLGDRSQYASDPVFSKVEKFSADPLTGALTYRVQTAKPVTQPKVLLRVPLKFVQVGVSSITYTASYYDADVKRQPANSGYQRVAGYKDAPDPMLLSSLFGENNTLDGLSVTQNLTIMKTEEQSMGALEMDLGVTALEEVQSDEQADVVIEFSKRAKTIGRGQWVRLDVMVTKFPEYETLGGVQFKVKYDPNYFTYTDEKGQEAAAVAVNDVFNFGFVNKVDRVKGEISLSLGVGLLLNDQTLLKPPVSTVSLYFKCMREGTSTVTLEDVKVPVSRQGSKLSRHDAIINISSSEKGCDGDLPATLCSGSFKTFGDVRFSLNNQNETLRTAVRTLDDRGDTVENPNVRIRRFYLEQTWNLNMNGSFKNGVRMQGHMLKSPHQEQNLSISLIGADTTAMFGDFNISMADSNLVSLTSSEATGLLIEHKIKGFTVKGLSAELNSSNGEASITGQGHRGPYVIPTPTGPIIPPSLGVYKNGVRLEQNEYTMDFGRNQISFTEPLLSNESVALKYQISSLLFSTGNIQAVRMNYANKPGTFSIGSTYFITESPKSNTFAKLSASDIVRDSDAVRHDIEGGAATSTFVCGFFGNNKCMELQLEHPYIVPGSMIIKNNNVSGSAQYYESSPYVYIDHRGYLEGQIYVDLEKFGAVNLTVSYSYYNPSVITQQSFNIYEIQGRDSTSNDLGRWRTDMFPGSEVLYLSDDTNYDVTEGQDLIVCYQKASGDIDRDETLFCPGTYSYNSNLTYYLQGTDSNQYVQISGLVSNKKYLKVKYTPVPPDVAGGSAFQKVAWGLDSEFKLGKKTTIKAEYAQANSDLSSSFNTTKEEIYQNSITTNKDEISGDPEFTKCWHVPRGTGGTGISDDYVACKLNRANLFGSVNIKIQKCNRTDGSLTTCEEYSPTENDVIIPMSDVNLKEGRVFFWRSRWPSASPVAFPSYGDKFYVTYTYDQSLDQVVTGEAMLLDLAYDSRLLKVNLKKRSRDPLFDKAVSKLNDNITDQLTGDFTLALGHRWSFNYNFKTAQEETVDKSGILSSFYERPSTGFTLKFNPGVLSSIQYNRTENKTSGYTLGTLGQRTDTETYTAKDAVSASFATKNNRYSITSNISKDKNEFRSGTQQNTDSTSQIYNITYNPSRKFSLAHNISIINTDPTGLKAVSRGYTFTVKTFPIVDITLGYTQNRNRNQFNEPDQFTEDKRYTMSFKPFMGIENMTLNFTRNDKPGGTTQQPYRQRNDDQSLSFRTKLKKTVTFSPTFSRHSTGMETQSWSLTHAMNWNLQYEPPSRFNPKVTLTQSRSSGVQDTLAGANRTRTFSFSLTRALTLDFNPTKKSKSTLTMNRSSGYSAARSINLMLRFDLKANLTMTTSMSTSRSFGASPSKSITQDLGLAWKLSTDTDVNIKYSKSVSRSSYTTSQTIPVTTFSTELTTKFK